MKPVAENDLATEYAFREEDGERSQDLTEELNLTSPIPDLNAVSFLKRDIEAKAKSYRSWKVAERKVTQKV